MIERGVRSAFLCGLLAVASVLLAGAEEAEETGFIQVNGEAGMQVFLDGKPAGDILEDEPPRLVIPAVPAGDHEIRVATPGIAPQTLALKLAADEIKLISVTVVDAGLTFDETGDALPTTGEDIAGSIELVTVPVECEVAIEGLDLADKAQKTKTSWKLGGLAPGRYRITCMTGGQVPIAVDAALEPKEDAVLLFNLLDSTVRDLSEATAEETWSAAHRGKPWKLNKPEMSFAWVEPLEAWMAVNEVTNAQYRAFREEHNSGTFQGYDLNGDSQPVVRVSANDAEAFAQWLNEQAWAAGDLPHHWGFRLPTPSEWLLAARGGTDGKRYVWGDSWPPKYGNFRDRNSKLPDCHWDYEDDFVVSSPVQDSGANEWKLLGMGGNVAEWTAPDETASSLYRVLCGGSWRTVTQEFLALDDQHYRLRPDDKTVDGGFRLVLAPIPAAASMPILPVQVVETEVPATDTDEAAPDGGGADGGIGGGIGGGVDLFPEDL